MQCPLVQDVSGGIVEGSCEIGDRLRVAFRADPQFRPDDEQFAPARRGGKFQMFQNGQSGRPSIKCQQGVDPGDGGLRPEYAVRKSRRMVIENRQRRSGIVVVAQALQCQAQQARFPRMARCRRPGAWI